MLHKSQSEEDDEANYAMEDIEQKIEEELSKYKQDKVEVYLAIFRYIKVLIRIEECIQNI